MATMAVPAAAAGVLDGTGLEALIAALRDRGYTVIAPSVADGAIAYVAVASAAELPTGVGDEQAPGRYRLRARDDTARFGFATAPSSWKRHLYPPVTTLWEVRRDPEGKLVFQEGPPQAARYAFLGVRACELTAILVQDRVFATGAHPDPTYTARRRDLFIIAVHCGSPAQVCFCASMNTGPRVGDGYDLALTELLDGAEPRYLVEVGTTAGEELLRTLPLQPASDADRDASRAVTDQATAHMGRSMETDGLPEMLQRNLEHPRWEDVAARCLSCGNCTMACPTCFCSDDVESQPPNGETSTRVRQWASCFSHDFSSIHGGTVRQTVRSRYRQWMTHKLGTWWEQFGTSGCVGCGRCITWCPVGIDITEEAAAIRASDGLRGDAPR
jgi:sulfhydrogenase subunit beta (sulfur reductase)